MLSWFLGYVPNDTVQTFCKIEQLSNITYTCSYDCNCVKVSCGKSMCNECDKCYKKCTNTYGNVSYTVNDNTYYGKILLNDSFGPYTNGTEILCYYNSYDNSKVVQDQPSSWVFLAFFIIFLVIMTILLVIISVAAFIHYKQYSDEVAISNPSESEMEQKT